MKKPEYATALSELITDSRLAGQTCSICDKPFDSREQKDNAAIVGKNPFAFAHDACFRLIDAKRQRRLEEIADRYAKLRYDLNKRQHAEVEQVWRDFHKAIKPSPETAP